MSDDREHIIGVKKHLTGALDHMNRMGRKPTMRGELENVSKKFDKHYQ